MNVSQKGGGDKINLWFKDEKTQLFKLWEYTVWV